MPESTTTILTGPVLEQWQKALEIWESGGWAMWAIAGIALVIFSIGLRVLFDLRGRGHRSVPERVWRRWIDHPGERTGPIGELLDFATGGKTLKDTQLFFQQLRTTELVPFERDLKVMGIFVNSAPLVGLLGTVTGMLATFGALSSGSGGDKTMGMIAEGISEALVTTETGLIVALPGLFFQSILLRNLDRYRAFMAHLETVCTQLLHRRASLSRDDETRHQARLQVAAMLRDRLMGGGELIIELPPGGDAQGPRPQESHGTL